MIAFIRKAEPNPDPPELRESKICGARPGDKKVIRLKGVVDHYV